MKLTPEYKCRRCGEIVLDPTINSPNDAEIVSELFSDNIDEFPYFIVDNQITQEKTRDYKIYYSSSHVCSDGGVGRTDLIGVRVKVL